MTMLAERIDVAEDNDVAKDTRKDAEAAYIAALNQIVSLSTLAGGRHGYDFQVEVPATEVHLVTQRLVELEYEVRDSYGVRFRTYVIPS